MKFASTVDRQRRHLLLASLATAGARSSWARQDPGAGNRKLYLYNGPDREEKLLAAARKEGKASSYTSLNTRDSGPITEAFEKKYGIKTALWRASSEKVVQRAVTEARSGRRACDVLETNGPEMEVLYREKLLAQFHSPHFKDLPAAAFPPHRHYVADRFNFFVIAWNTNLVKPTKYRIRTRTWCIRALPAASQMRTGHTLLAELLSSGEVPLAAAIYNHSVEKMAQRGAPVKWKALAPTFGRPNAIGLAPLAPNPHAGLLFGDFMLWREGQILLKERNRVPASQAVESSLNNFPFQMIDPVIALDENEKWDKLWSQLFLGGQKVRKETE